MQSEDNSDDENYGPAPKKMKSEWSKSYSNKAMEMMKKMGYEKDKGLGKQSQGRLEPIIAIQKDGRRGLGLKSETFQSNNEEWDPSREEILLPEKVTWISNKANFNIVIEDLRKWLKVGPRKCSLNGETKFCDPEILQNVLDAKTVFDQLNENDLRRARSRCNPFETIRSSIFLNRAAVKMANIDSMCDYIFTDPKDRRGNSILRENELLYFADICAGPGGFSEYILYRKSWEAKGFGFTLKGANDFKLDKFFAGSPESFDPFYGVKDDGDIFDQSNQDSFAEYVLKHCEDGVHFVMADGGFSVDGQENIQEILSKQLYLCQCLVALKILRIGGHFVCKLFDLFTSFSVGLVFLMYHCFENISIIKPNSSRPANSERYIVCKWKKANTSSVCTYLNLANSIFNQNNNNDVIELVSLDEIFKNKEFVEYITSSNNEIGKNQIIGLQKIAAFCRNSQLKENRQSEFRKRCIELWNLPDKIRQAPDMKVTDKILEEILGDWFEDKTLLNSLPKELSSIDNVQSNIESSYDWYFMPVGRSETNINACSLFLCKSRGNLLRYTDSKKWDPVNIFFEISPKSLFYGEIVYEYNGEGRTQTRVYALHIIDAIMLGGIDIRRKKLSERISICHKYALSLNKPYKKENDGKYGSIRSKSLYPLLDMNNFFKEMRPYQLKNSSTRLGFSIGPNKFFVPGGIILFCSILHNYFSKMSKTRKMLYYFDKEKRESYYEDCIPPQMQNMLYASFRNCFMRRLLWKWTSTQQVEECVSEKSNKLLFRQDFLQFINNLSNK